MAAEIASLEHTPTWALAIVCFLFISTSIVLERSIHFLTNWLNRRQKHALIDAVKKLESELMLLGIMSLLLAGTQSTISDICVPAKVADIMLPCRKKASQSKINYGVQAYDYHQHSESKNTAGNFSSVNGLEYDDILWKIHRRLADEQFTAASDPYRSKGKVSLMTLKVMRQLQQFIFVLAVMQIVYIFLTMALGRAKMRRWKAWEKETQTIEYQAAHDPERFRIARQTSFARRHVSYCAETSVQLWIKCFIRQFFNPVAKVDFLTLRHGFISAHFSGRKRNFNFQEYIERSLDEDFKMVVSISPLMWFIFVVFMLVDIHGWHVFFWVSFIPLMVVLTVGTKLEVIVARMALQINNQNTVVRGTPLVQPSDEFFWFKRPRFVLTLLHFTLFMNAFELAFFIWVSVSLTLIPLVCLLLKFYPANLVSTLPSLFLLSHIQFGLDSCYHDHTAVVITRIVLPMIVQVLCSYITLPLYALVTQMGSKLKSPILEDKIAKIMKQWHAGVRERREKQELLQSPFACFSTQWSSTTASQADQCSSFSRPSLRIISCVQLSNRGEITEEPDEMAEVEAGPSQPIVLENPMLKKG